MANNAPPFTTDNPITPAEVGTPSVIIEQNDVSYTDQDNDFERVGGASSVFADYRMVNRYEKDGHRYMAGITSPDGFQGNAALQNPLGTGATITSTTQGASVAFFQLTAPTLLWIADWSASKAGEQPEIPSSDAPPGWILLDSHMEPVMIKLMAGANVPLYRISGTYVYGATNPADLLYKDVVYPRPPWLDDVFDRNVDPSDLLGDLTDETSQGPAAGNRKQVPGL